MTIRNGFPGASGIATFDDIRRDLEALIIRDQTGAIRTGILPNHTNPLVTAKASMAVDVAAFRGVVDRNGAVLLANDGAVSVPIPAGAPASQSRIDLIYMAQKINALGDADNLPIIGIKTGDVSATPTPPPITAAGIPAGAVPLAQITIPAGAVTTQSSGVVITQVYPYTTTHGGLIYARSLTELNGFNAIDGTRAHVLASDNGYVRKGGAWTRPTTEPFLGSTVLSNKCGVPFNPTLHSKVVISESTICPLDGNGYGDIDISSFQLLGIHNVSLTGGNVESGSGVVRLGYGFISLTNISVNASSPNGSGPGTGGIRANYVVYGWVAI